MKMGPKEKNTWRFYKDLDIYKQIVQANICHANAQELLSAHC